MEKRVLEEFFNKVLNSRLEKTKFILGVKAKEYVRNGDRLHNFNVAATTNKESREKALWGMATKHLVSVMDMINDTEEGKMPSDELVDEKIGDLINYLILLEVSFKSHDKELVSVNSPNFIAGYEKWLLAHKVYEK